MYCKNLYNQSNIAHAMVHTLSYMHPSLLLGIYLHDLRIWVLHKGQNIQGSKPKHNGEGNTCIVQYCIATWHVPRLEHNLDQNFTKSI